MAEVDAGAPAPAVTVADAPAANAVPAPDVPTVTDNAEAPKADQSVQPPKTYSEEETRRLVNDRLTKERKRLERTVRAEVERDYLKQQLETRTQPPPGDQPKGKPQYKDFEGQANAGEAFVEALADWKLEQRDAKRAEETKARTEEREDREAIARDDAALTKASEKFPDLKSRLIEADAFLTKPMFDFVVDAEQGGPAVGDYFANNPGESHRIANLPPHRQILELHKIASRLSAPPEITKTPPPIKPGGSTSAVEKPWDELSQAEFNERRRRQKAQLNR